MPITKSDIPNSLLAGLKTVFFQAYDTAVAGLNYRDLVTEVESNSESETYAWLGALPSVREFVDERVIKAMAEYSYTIQNKTWEATIGVDRAAIEDDKYGQILMRVRALANQIAQHRDEIVINTLVAGTSTICYDGHYFFDTDHSSGASGTQSNLGTTALSAAAIQNAITAMNRFKDDQGRPMGINPNVLLVPPDLQWYASELLASAQKTDSSVNNINPLAGKLRLVVSPWLSDTNNWYLLDTTKVVRPLILQDRTPVTFDAMENQSDSGFMRDQYLYGVRARYNVGYGLWQCAYASIVS